MGGHLFLCVEEWGCLMLRFVAAQENNSGFLLFVVVLPVLGIPPQIVWVADAGVSGVVIAVNHKNLWRKHLLVMCCEEFEADGRCLWSRDVGLFQW
jgi:hypothetical protein